MVRLSFVIFRRCIRLLQSSSRWGAELWLRTERCYAAVSLSITVFLGLSRVCALLGPYYACAQNDSIPPGYAAISLGDCAFGIDLSLHLTWIGLCSRSCIQDKTAPACYASITLGDCAFGFESRLFLDAGQITQSCFCAKEGAVSF